MRDDDNEMLIKDIAQNLIVMTPAVALFISKTATLSMTEDKKKKKGKDWVRPILRSILKTLAMSGSNSTGCYYRVNRMESLKGSGAEP